MNLGRHQGGYTLVELLLYISMVGTLLLGVSAFFTIVVEARIKNQTMAEVDQQGAAAMEYITQTLRGATGVTMPVAATSAPSLTALVPTANVSPTMFDLHAGNLQVQEGATAPVALTGGKLQVDNLTFTNLSRSGTPGTIRISLTASRVNPSGKNEFDYQKTFITSVTLR